MTEFVRTADENFDNLPNFPFAPNYHQWQDLGMHYVDEGPKDAPVMLLPHGMPTWAYLYRDMIPGFVQAGYRCIAPDHMGFGRSDKPTDIHWYTIGLLDENIAQSYMLVIRMFTKTKYFDEFRAVAQNEFHKDFASYVVEQGSIASDAASSKFS